MNYPTNSTPHVSIVIPVHNQLQFTRQCLDSIENNTEPGIYEVIVVNDASSDGTEAFLHTWSGVKPWLRVVTNIENLGFARSCNEGARQANSNYLMFLNNDTLVTPGWLSPLVKTLEEYPDIGIVAPKLIFPDGTIQHCGKVWSEWQLPRSHPDHIYYREPGDAAHVNRPRDYQMLTGACLLLRREEFFRYGPFDEQYENGWEDDDLCYAYRGQGMRINYCPTVTVVHFQSISINEGLSQDEELLRQLMSAASSGGVPDPVLPKLSSKVEARLADVRSRFERNRSHFFTKWEQRIFRDDYLYHQADGLEGCFYGDDRPQPLVSIIILTFNQLPYTIECVESIQRHTQENYELIFIDNGSTDGTVQWLKTYRDQEPTRRSLIVNDANRGFAAGCNQGLAAAHGDYLLLLNNDVVVTKGWLGGLLSCFRLRPDTGLVGPLTNNISGLQRLSVSPTEPQDGLDAFAERFKFQYGGRRIYQRRIVGFCMLFSRELFNKVGYLDESFGSGNFEDDDYCLRAELEGYRNVIAGDVFIHHYGSVSFRANKINYSNAMSGNRSIFNKKWRKTISEPTLARKIVTLKTCEEADRLSQQGQANAAVDLLLRDGIAQIPAENRFYRQIAEYLLEGGMAEEALQTLEYAPLRDCDAGVLFLRSRALAMLNRNSELNELESRATYCHPVVPGLHLIMGMRSLADGNTAGAYNEFGTAARLDVANEKAYLGLARTAELQGDLVGAFNLYVWAITVAPGNREAARGLQQFAESAEQRLKAVRLLEESLYFKEDDRDLRFLLIDLLIKAGASEKALEHTEHAMKLFGADPGLVSAACALRRQVGPMKVSAVRTADGVSVSLCMIVKNEEKSLPRCLASLKPIVDEIIVCDTGSTDATREIAEAFGARVIEQVWSGDFSAARNCSIEKARGTWILVMDADEVISPLDYDNFRALVCEVRDAGVACSITTRNYTNKLVEKWQDHDGHYPAEEAGRGWMPSDKVRLFPNRPEIRFENALHEMVEQNLDRLGIAYPMASSIVVHHYGYLDNDRQETKKTLYYEIGVKKLRESGDSPKAIVELAIQAAGIERYQEAVDLWQRALAYNPASPLAWFNIGYAYLCLGRYDEAFDATKRALELQRDYREALANLALIEILRGRQQAALEMLKTQVGAEDDYVMFVLIRAVAYCCSQEHMLAVELFRSVTERQIEFGTFITTTVRHLRQSGRGHDADTVVAIACEAECCLAESES